VLRDNLRAGGIFAVPKRIWYAVIGIVAVALAVSIVFAVHVSPKHPEVKDLKSFAGNLGSDIDPVEVFEDSFVYVNMDEIKYYRQYFDGRGVSELGQIDNFVLGVKANATVNNVLYFYTTVSIAGTDGEFGNNLYGIDLENNQLSLYHTDNEVNPAAMVYPYMGNLLALKSRTYDSASKAGIYETYLENYDINTGSTEKVIEQTMDYTNLTGSMILACFVNGSKIYTLNDDFAENGDISPHIMVYGENFQLEQTIYIDDDTADYIRSSRPNEIAVFGDYVYMRNYSGYAVVGKIEENVLVPILQTVDLELALNRQDDRAQNIQMFYIRWTNTYYILDAEKGTFEELTLEPYEDYVFMYAKANSDNVMIFLSADYDEPSDKKDDKYIFTDISALQ
jgi:hypothetical protein